jgi:hypothetical protein
MLGSRQASLPEINSARYLPRRLCSHYEGGRRSSYKVLRRCRHSMDGAFQDL